MTVTYTSEVANARLGGFSRLLVRWRGSVYKLFYKEMLIYISLYTVISMIYRYALDGNNKIYFERLCLQFQHYTDLVPVSFVLGFYVTIVVGRWWSQYENVPWPDRLMVIIGANVHGADERGRLLRRTLLRYLNLTEVLTYRSVSRAVYKRFPTIDHVVRAGLMTSNEYQHYESFKTDQIKYWVPIMWFSNLLTKIRQEGRIYDDMTFKLLLEEVNAYRGHCGWLIGYDWISVPLVYTQVVTIAVYMFFMSTLLSRQYLDVTANYPGHEVDLYVPIFTIGQFFFYMGWLKVAEQLINPFGEDDDDFEVNMCIDRNHELAMKVADQMYAKHPKLEKDKFWNAPNFDIPYTAASVNHKVEPYMGSTFDMRVDKENRLLGEDLNSNFLLPTVKENVSESSNHPKTKASDVTSVMTSSRLFASFRSSKQDPDKTKLLKDEENLSDNSDTGVLEMEFDVTNTDPITEDESSVSERDDDDVDDDAVHGGDEKEKDELTSLNSVEMAKEQKLKKKRSKENIIDDSGQRVHKSPKKKSNEPAPLIRSKRSFVLQHAAMDQMIDSDEEEDRRNAEERSHLSNRKRRSKGFLPPRKRRFFRPDRKSLAFRHQQRLRNEAIGLASPDTASLFSETDVNSGANSSPFGSSLSFATSIPSPKQLRWAYRIKTRELYGDNLSVQSPSGMDGETSPALSPLNIEVPFYKPHDDTGSTTTLGLTPEPLDSIPMPFTENLRRRLQVIKSSSPSSRRHHNIDVSNNNNLLMIAPTNSGIIRPSPTRFTPSNVSTDESDSGKENRKAPHSTATPQNKRKPIAAVNTKARDSPAVTELKTSGSFWKAIKDWSARRKQRKLSAGIRSINSESDVIKLNDLSNDVTEFPPEAKAAFHSDDEGLVMSFSPKSKDKVRKPSVSRSEEGRNGVLEGHDPDKRGSGEVTWENECQKWNENANNMKRPTSLSIPTVKTETTSPEKANREDQQVQVIQEIGETESKNKDLQEVNSNSLKQTSSPYKNFTQNNQKSEQPLIELKRQDEDTASSGDELSASFEKICNSEVGESHMYRKHTPLLTHYLDSIPEKVSDEETHFPSKEDPPENDNNAIHAEVKIGNKTYDDDLISEEVQI